MPLIINPPFKTSDSALGLYVPLWAGELSGSSFKSRDTYKHLCTVTGALWTPQGRSFDGTDDFIEVPNSNSWRGTQFTILLWSQLSATKNNGLSCHSGPSGAGGWYAAFYSTAEGTDCTFAVGGTSAPFSSTAIVDTSFNFMGVSRNGTTARVVINGQDEGNKTVGADASGTNSLYIERDRNSGTYYGGAIMGEVLIYSRALTLSEIQRIYLATKWRYS